MEESRKNNDEQLITEENIRKLKITPISSIDEVKLTPGDGLSIIGLFVSEDFEGVKLNVSFPSKYSYSPVLSNMNGFKDNYGVYFLAGDFPDPDDRPIYIIDVSEQFKNSLIVDAYSQTNGNILNIGKKDLLEYVIVEKRKSQLKAEYKQQKEKLDSKKTTF